MQQTKFNYTNLYAGNVAPVVRGAETLAKGQKIEVGTVLGLINSQNKVVPVDKAASDGSQKVYAVANDNFDATDGDLVITVDYTGEFNQNVMKFAPNNTVADHKLNARLVGIFFKPAIKA